MQQATSFVERGARVERLFGSKHLYDGIYARSLNSPFAQDKNASFIERASRKPIIVPRFLIKTGPATKCNDKRETFQLRRPRSRAVLFFQLLLCIIFIPTRAHFCPHFRPSVHSLPLSNLQNKRSRSTKGGSSEPWRTRTPRGIQYSLITTLNETFDGFNFLATEQQGGERAAQVYCNCRA